jgi:hypothetical protein
VPVAIAISVAIATVATKGTGTWCLSPDSTLTTFQVSKGHSLVVVVVPFVVFLSLVVAEVCPAEMSMNGEKSCEKRSRIKGKKDQKNMK